MRHLSSRLLTSRADGYELFSQPDSTNALLTPFADAPNTQPDANARMDPSVDPRVNRPTMSLEAGPSRCHMETSFYNILHSSGFAEWAARAEEQNERLRTGTWTQKKDAGSCPLSESPLSESKSSVESSATSARPAHRLPKRATRSRKLKEAEEKPPKTPSIRSKRSDVPGEKEDEDEEQEDRNDSCPAETFVARYSNYSSMDTELNILTKHLMQHRGC